MRQQQLACGILSISNKFGVVYWLLSTSTSIRLFDNS